MKTSLDLAAQLGSDLSSRHGAATLRERVLDVVNSGVSPCLLNMAGVRSVSHSFADELFAVLVEEQGEDWFKANVQVCELSPAVRQTILEAIQQRLYVCH